MLVYWAVHTLLKWRKKKRKKRRRRKSRRRGEEEEEEEEERAGLLPSTFRDNMKAPQWPCWMALCLCIHSS